MVSLLSVSRFTKQIGVAPIHAALRAATSLCRVKDEEQPLRVGLGPVLVMPRGPNNVLYMILCANHSVSPGLH